MEDHAERRRGTADDKLRLAEPGPTGASSAVGKRQTANAIGAPRTTASLAANRYSDGARDARKPLAKKGGAHAMKRGIVLLITATILWGGNYICGRYLAHALPSTLLNTIRWAISSVLLFAVMAVNKTKVPIITQWKELSILGFFGMFAFSTLNYLGLRLIHASQAGMISAGIPVAILIFTPVVLKEHVKGRAWLGTAFSIIGVMILLFGKHSTASHGSLLGDLEIVLSCLAWGLYTVFGKRYSKHMTPLVMTAGAAVYGTIFSAMSCIGTVAPAMIHMSINAWLAVIYVSTFASVVAYFAWNAGVTIVGTGKAAPYINLLPVWTVVFGVLLLQERISWLSLVGGVITIGGAVMASWRGRSSQRLVATH